MLLNSAVVVCNAMMHCSFEVGRVKPLSFNFSVRDAMGSARSYSIVYCDTAIFSNWWVYLKAASSGENGADGFDFDLDPAY